MKSLLFLSWPAVLLVSCQSPASPASPTVKAVVVFDSVKRGANAPFRYFGTVQIKSPRKYAGTRADLVALSFGTNLESFKGKTIEVIYSTEDLDRTLRPNQDPFVMGPVEPRLMLEYTDTTFAPVDFGRYQATSVAVEARIKSNNLGDKERTYFIFDMGLTGDMVEVEILAPEKYRGSLSRVLATDRPDPRWRRLGATLNFEASEEMLALQPWDFSPVSDLKNLRFDPTN